MKYRSVTFDFDSTLVTIEGINELARIKGVYNKVCQLTDQAMNGDFTFEQVFYQRLRLIKPTIKDLDQVAQLYTQNITPGAKQIVRKLMLKGINVHIISGGYLQAILPTAKILGIPQENVHTINLVADEHGFYTQVADDLLVSHNGKSQQLHQLDLPRKIAFIGDGSTDAMVGSSVDTFIGFGGVVKRPAIVKQANIYVSSPSLMSVYKYLN